MSTALADADQLLQQRGTTQQLGAYVVATAFARTGQAGFALGDGTFRIAAPEAGPAWSAIPAHDGAILAMTPAADGWLTGGDDGAARRIAPDGTVTELARFGARWVEHVAAWDDAKSTLLAVAVGKSVHLFGADGTRLKTLDHPSTVGGLAFDPKGKRIAAAHYNGVTLWFVAAKTDSPRRLEWKGSHIGLAIHPGNDAIVTAMQENALHGWRLADGQHMRMSGYPAKTESLSFSRNGRWLASSGAESVVLWPFFSGGPMGKPPLELAGGDGILCTRVAFHPQQDMVAAGFSDGLVVVTDVSTQRVLPIAAPGRGPVTALAWSPDGSRLAFGTEPGFAAIVDLSKR